jgi:hypothetical protein
VKAVEPAMLDSNTGASSPRRPYRPALVILGGAAGIVLGFAILTALAHPAGASPVPISPSAISVPGVPSLPTAPRVTAAAASIASPVSTPAASERSAVLPAVSNRVDPLSSGALTAVGAGLAQIPDRSVTDTMGALAMPPPGVLPTGITTRGSGAPLSTVGPLARRDIERGATPINGPQAETLTSGLMAPAPSPSPPTPNPTAPDPSPVSPLTSSSVDDYSPPSQGNSPSGSLPPSSLLLPALVLGGVFLVRGKNPQLLLDARSFPPG